MAKNEVNVNIGELFISITTEHSYPDVIDDMIKRTRELARGIIEDIKLNGVDIDNLFESLHVGDFDGEDDDTEEDA